MHGEFSRRAVSDDQRLPDGILWYMARNFALPVRNLACLSLASRNLYGLVEPFLYRRDVETIRDMQVKHATKRGKAFCANSYKSLNCIERFAEDSKIMLTMTFTALQLARRRGDLKVAQKAIKAAREVFPPYMDTRGSAS
ncbi:Uu.00g139120.m01.CDS01 [Anthostomella pinea]|uniref:Uu.00g139120.m01.CDS01 n=1 Tax=Anthostomella pinea TaxID=933095 RepID=A0AAI8VPX9_9PEZI|nr:Uu.00g139120.m01.CDS01 [Anthostomella pinea]